jgi:hypothetical protein
MIDIEALRAEMEAESSEGAKDPISVIREFEDPATAATGAVGATMVGVVAYDAIRNGRGEGDRLFQGATGWTLAVVGSLLFGVSVGRLGRGKKAQQEAEELMNLMEKLEEKKEEEEEERKEKAAEEQKRANQNAMMLTNPDSFSASPMNFGLNMGFGEFGGAVGQSLLAYHPNQ